MKIKELIKLLEQFNPDGEIVRVYDCMREKLDIGQISIYNGNMPFDGDTLDLTEKDEKNLSGDNYYDSWGLIIENK